VKQKKIKEKKLDKAFSIYIRNRDGKCLRCEKKENLQCAHIFSRTSRATRWEDDNAVCLCYSCHMFWAHKNPVEFTEFVKTLLGEVRYQNLRTLAKSIKKWTEQEKLELLTEIEEANEKHEHCNNGKND
jgi:hypothetical protein